jgi:hypothetical protein
MSKRDENINARATIARPKAKKGKRAAPRLPLLEVAHDCAVFAVDPAAKSGYSMWDRGNLRSYGECDVFGDMPRTLLNTFLSMPGPHIVVIERPFRLRFGTQMGLGTGAKIWTELARRMGLGKRTLRIYPPTWRSKVLGKAWVSAKRDAAQAEEMRVATALVEQHQGPHALKFSPLGAESAPAVCIGRYGSFSPDVLAVLPKPKPEKLIPVERVKFGRYAIRTKPRKRIERATDGDGHMVATWLFVDGVVSKRGDRITPEQYARAEIKLGYDLTGDLPDDGSLCDVIRYHTMIPIGASSAEIEAGWHCVADQVERAMKARAA